MRTEELSPAELLDQLLTTDYGGVEQKRVCLIRLLRNPALATQALALLEHRP